MFASDVNDQNASSLNDSYRVEDKDGLVFYMETNASEAKALASWLTNRGGRGYIVKHIPPHIVAAAKAIRKNVLRHPLRDEAFAETGVR